MYTVYILESHESGRFYIGHTGNLVDRIMRHNSGRSKATKYGMPWKIVYTKKYRSRSDAVKHELEIKRHKKRSYIKEIIEKSAGV